MVTQLKPETLTLPDLITRFLGRHNLSPRTRDYYSNILAHLGWYARKNHWPEPVEEISRGHVRDFLDYVATERHRWPEGRRSSYQKAAPATVYHYGKAVKTFLNWAEDEEYLEATPIARLKLGAPHYRDVEPYSLRRTRDGNLLLYAIKSETSELRSYRVDRIQSVKATNIPFKPRYVIEFASTGPLSVPSTRRSRGLTTPKTIGRHGMIYIVECSLCGKRFKRSKLDTRLKSHRSKDGDWNCPGCIGYLVDEYYALN